MGNGFAPLVAALTLSGGMAAATCAPDAAELRGPGAVMRFSVEVADDNAERAKGLMFRESLPTSGGMLFVYESPRRASFWMKNTPLPLDLIFMDATGTVTRVHENAVPFDTTSIDGGDGVQFVLEINGGLAARLGLGPGAVMRHPAVGQATAAWPCE
jgi:uncharacterized protein